jgi:hypothetical protein
MGAFPIGNKGEGIDPSRVGFPNRRGGGRQRKRERPRRAPPRPP